jgi:hypothetical protein
VAATTKTLGTGPRLMVTGAQHPLAGAPGLRIVTRFAGNLACGGVLVVGGDLAMATFGTPPLLMPSEPKGSPKLMVGEVENDWEGASAPVCT